MIRWWPALVLGCWHPTTTSPGRCWPEHCASRRSAVSSGCRRHTVRWLVRLQGRRAAAPSTQRTRGRRGDGRQPARTEGATGRRLGATSVDGSWPPLCACSQRGAHQVKARARTVRGINGTPPDGRCLLTAGPARPRNRRAWRTGSAGGSGSRRADSAGWEPRRG
jgi:hypothetical protein